MQTQAQHLNSLFRLIILAAVTALLITSAALPMSAQSSVPATARQAARMPQFASRLAHPAPTHTPEKSKASVLTGRYSPGQSPIYDNGPVNGEVDAWTINFGFTVTNSIQLPTNSTVQGVSFWAWLFPGDTITNVQVSIGTQPFGSDLFDATISLSQSRCFANEYGFNVCLETASIQSNPNLSGNAWITLQNANVPNGDPVYWDENSGVGCSSQGCPSQAEANTVGTIPSEAFTVLGSDNCFTPEERPVSAAKVVTVPPSPTLNYRAIYNFTGAADGSSPATGLVIDAAGNLYGTTGRGGPFGGGTVFKLTPGASGWLFTRLYSFSGPNGAGPDSTLVLGPDGRLFGTTHTGGAGDGVLFGLSPAAHILPTVFSNWMETLRYSFTGRMDGANPGGSLVLDGSGNIFGTAAAGGFTGNGTLYEFTNGGLQVLHAFFSFPNDGATPIGVVKGSDGLYGITGSGGQHNHGTFYTTAGGYQVLHSFVGAPDPVGSPVSLAADQAGNLYGAANYLTACGLTATSHLQIFSVSPPDWNPFILTSLQQEADMELSSWMSTDSVGNIYGTTNSLGFFGNVFKLTCCWNYTDLHDFGFGSDGDTPEGGPVVDAQGNIYGTTQYGGTYGFGTVWEITP